MLTREQVAKMALESKERLGLKWPRRAAHCLEPEWQMASVQEVLSRRPVPMGVTPRQRVVRARINPASVAPISASRSCPHRSVPPKHRTLVAEKRTQLD